MKNTVTKKDEQTRHPTTEPVITLPSALAAAFAAIQNRPIAEFENISINVSSLNPITAEKQRLEQEKENNPEPGQLMKNGTIYLGRYAPKNRDNKSLGKEFNVFAAPEDLPETMKYLDAVKYIAQLKGWHGYDGTNYPADEELYTDIENGSYAGGWIIPTRDILQGVDLDDEETMPDNLFVHQNTGAFNGNFKRKYDPPLCTTPPLYWSSTECRHNPFYVWVTSFSNGRKEWLNKNFPLFNCRPVRLVEVKK